MRCLAICRKVVSFATLFVDLRIALSNAVPELLRGEGPQHKAVLGIFGIFQGTQQTCTRGAWDGTDACLQLLHTALRLMRPHLLCQEYRRHNLFGV